MVTKLWPFGQKKKINKPKSEETGYRSLEMMRVAVGQLRLGMYVTKLDRPWVETPFLFQGFEIENEAELRTLREFCDHVYIDTTKKKVVQAELTPRQTSKMSDAQLATTTLAVKESDSASANKTVAPKAVIYQPPPKKRGNFEEEFSHASGVYENAETVVADFMKTVENGGGIDSVLAKNAVAECVNSILHSPDAMLWLAQLRHKDEHTAQHSLNVSLLSIVLGRHINLSTVDLNILGLCGMMHDVGKLLIPPEILNKSTLLDDDEIRTMKTHTRLGFNLLKSSDNMNQNVATVALTHHEQIDGKGYPRRLQDAAISHFTKIVSIANAYDAMTRDRSHQKGKTHLEATHLLTNLTGTQFDSALVVKFIESIGVYPPGSLVEMTNGSVAMVIETDENSKLRPKVIIILDENKRPVSERAIDLSKLVKDSRGDVYTIRNIIKAKDWNLDVSKYYRKDLVKKSFAMAKSW